MTQDREAVGSTKRKRELSESSSDEEAVTQKEKKSMPGVGTAAETVILLDRSLILKIARDAAINFIKTSHGKPADHKPPHSFILRIKKDNQEVVRITNNKDWLRTAGALSKWLVAFEAKQSSALFPTKISAGIGATPVPVQNLQGEAHVKFPQGGGRYIDIHQFIKSLTHDESLPDQFMLGIEYFLRTTAQKMQHKGRSSSSYFSLLDSLPDTMMEALDETHKQIAIDPYLLDVTLARALLNRIHGVNTKEYSKEACDYLDALLILMIGVEGSRNNTTFLMALLHLDLVVAKIVNTDTGFPYSFRDFFASDCDARWENSDHENFPGAFPMAATATGPGNLSERSNMFGNPTDKDSVAKLKPRLMEEAVLQQPQHHRVILKEMDIVYDWITALPFSERSQLVSPDNYTAIFLKRLRLAYSPLKDLQSDREYHLSFLPVNAQAAYHPDHTYAIGTDERQACYYRRNSASKKDRDRERIKPIYYHKANERCKVIHEEYDKAEKVPLNLKLTKIRKNVNSVEFNLNQTTSEVTRHPSHHRKALSKHAPSELLKMEQDFKREYTPLEEKIMREIYGQELRHFSQRAKHLVYMRARETNEQNKMGYSDADIRSMVDALVILNVNDENSTCDYVIDPKKESFIRLHKVLLEAGKDIQQLMDLVMESLLISLQNEDARFLITVGDKPRVAPNVDDCEFKLKETEKLIIINNLLIKEFPGFPYSSTNGIIEKLGRKLVDFLRAPRLPFFDNSPLDRIANAIGEGLLKIALNYTPSFQVAFTTDPQSSLCPCPECYRRPADSGREYLDLLVTDKTVMPLQRKQNQHLNFSQPAHTEENSWYDDRRVNILLRHYFGSVASDMKLLHALPLDNEEGITAQLIQNELTREFAENPTINLFYLPLRINGNHWVSLYVDRTAGNPLVYWIDPYGGLSPAKQTQIRTILNDTNIFNVPLTDAHIHFQEHQLQKDGVNCGPWIIEILRYLRTKGSLPRPQEIDINACRDEHRAILRMPPLHTEPAAAVARKGLAPTPDKKNKEALLSSSSSSSSRFWEPAASSSASLSSVKKESEPAATSPSYRTGASVSSSSSSFIASLGSTSLVSQEFKRLLKQATVCVNTLYPATDNSSLAKKARERIIQYKQDNYNPSQSKNIALGMWIQSMESEIAKRNTVPGPGPRK